MAGIIFSILFAMATGVWFYFLNKKAKKIHHNITLMNNELEGKKTTYKNIEDLIAKGKEKIDELTKEQDELSRNLLFESGKLDAQREQNKERLALLEIEQEKKKKEMLDRMRAEYATDAGKIVEELNQVKRSLSEERAK